MLMLGVFVMFQVFSCREQSHDVTIQLNLKLLFCKVTDSDSDRASISLRCVLGLWPFTLVPAALGNGGQLRDAAVAVEILGGPPRHDPLQLPVVGFAAFRGGVVWQALSHTLAPKQQLTVGNLKPDNTAV